MKKLYVLFSALLLFFSANSFSQSMTVAMPDTAAIGPVSSDIECYVGDTIYNNTPNNLTIDVVRVQNVNTGTWTTAFCLNVCYLPSKDSVRYTMTPNLHQGMIVHFYADATPATGDCIFKFKNVNTPSNTFYQGFHATSQSIGVHEVNAASAEVQIYPMPVIAGSDFSIGISNVKNAGSDLMLAVYDMLGNHAYSAAVHQGITFMNIDLPAGIYSYSLISGNEKLNSGKLAVSK